MQTSAAYPVRAVHDPDPAAAAADGLVRCGDCRRQLGGRCDALPGRPHLVLEQWRRCAEHRARRRA